MFQDTTSSHLRLAASPAMGSRRRRGLFRHCLLLFGLLAAGSASLLYAHGGAPDPALEGGVIYIDTVAPDDLTFLRQAVEVWGIRRPQSATDEGAPSLAPSFADRGYAVAWATVEEHRALVEAGYRVERDPVATDRLLNPPATTEGGGIPGFPCYRTVGETYADLAQLATDNPQIAQWIDIGDSWEKINGPGAGFDIHALVLTQQAIAGPKPPLMIIAAIHAREYTTAETATRFAEAMVGGYGTDPDITWFLDHFEIHIIPQLNPDGRTRAEGGLSWRKNVNNNFCSDSDTRGIDLNRNSSFLWGDSAGSSGNACSLIFRGPSAGSEPETMTIENYMAQVFTDQRGEDMGDAAPATAEGIFISLHSFSELVLFPWEGTSTDSPNHIGLQTLGRKFGFYNDYGVCQDCLGVASGTTPDQAYGEYGVAGYTLELGTTFFQSCSFFENDVLPKMMDTLRYAARATRRPYQNPAAPEIIDVTVDLATVAAGTPVTLTATADDGRFDSSGFGTEPTQNVVAVSYSIDAPPWDAGTVVPMAAVDGTFDSVSEAVTATVDTGALTAGRHLIYVFGEDELGNVGAPAAVFLTIEGDGAPLFADGFESGDVSGWSSSTSN